MNGEQLQDLLSLSLQNKKTETQQFKNTHHKINKNENIDAYCIAVIFSPADVNSL